MKKICMSFVFMFSMLQLSASQDNPVISTIVFTSSIAFIAWVQQPVWVNHLGRRIEQICQASDVTRDVEQYNLQSNDEDLLGGIFNANDQQNLSQLNYHEGQTGTDPRVYSSLESENNYNKYDADCGEEVASLLSSSIVYVTPIDYSK